MNKFGNWSIILLGDKGNCAFEFESCLTLYVFVRFEICQISSPRWLQFQIFQKFNLNYISLVNYSSSLRHFYVNVLYAKVAKVLFFVCM